MAAIRKVAHLNSAQEEGREGRFISVALACLENLWISFFEKIVVV